ncbi:MAG: VTT domain-containing protein [Bacteroidota bacterium]|nr:VTT domain-containing protein [Bacteroidota bacterium]
MELLQVISEEVPNVFDPQQLITYGGFWVLLLIVFAETGLLIGFFLPGDALLFAAGLLCANGKLDYSFWTVLLSINGAAILGNTVGYEFGKRVGEKLFVRENSLIFKKSYVALSKSFYDKHGGLALILGRFLPIIRTFAPIIAGVAKINPRKFLLYNIVGSLMWTITMVGSGYWLAKKFPWVGDHIGLITLGMIVVAMGTVIRTYIKEKRKIKAP